jgi:hypothetical protein
MFGGKGTGVCFGRVGEIEAVCLLLSSSDLVRSIGSRHLYVCQLLWSLAYFEDARATRVVFVIERSYLDRGNCLRSCHARSPKENASINSCGSERRCRVESSGILVIVLRPRVAGIPP